MQTTKPERSSPTSTPRRTRPLSKPRSLSQPASSTLKKIPYRPHSGGDEKKVFKQTSVSEDDDENYASATMLKASSELLSKTDVSISSKADGTVKSSPGDDTVSNPSPSVKASSSGIPLRVKQQQQQQQPPSPPPPPPPQQPPQQPRTNSPRPPSAPKKSQSKVATPRRPSPRAGGSESQVARTLSPAARRTLEIQFQAKKKRVDQLKKEIIDRQKPLLDTYQGLIQLQKKLEECGKVIPVDDLRMEDFAMGGDKPEINPETVKHMQQAIKDVPASLLELCKNLMYKRMLLVELLERMTQEPFRQDELQRSVYSLKEESTDLEKIVMDTYKKFEKHVEDLVEKWKILIKSSGNSSAFTEEIDHLKLKLKEKESNIAETIQQMQEVQKKYHDHVTLSENSGRQLRDKIKNLEGELTKEKTSSQESKDRMTVTEQRTKTLKSRLKESEVKCKESESKYSELQKNFKHLQEQLKSNERNWGKEKDDLLAKQKHDKQLLEKLTKDRSFYETRVKTLEELVEDKENKLKATEIRCAEQVEEARKEAVHDRSQRDTMQQKYDNIKEQLVQMEIRNKQAIGLVHSKSGCGAPEIDGISTEREAELYTELLATKVALRAAEDQIQNYKREKMRFIDSIQSLQGDPERDQEYIAKTLVKNVEKITELESKLTESEEIVCNQKIDIANLKVEIENLKQRPPPMSFAEAECALNSDSDLKMMLHEGRVKLEQALKKTLDYEHKIIRYEHDINKQGKHICEMENLLKVRDGLISMMKAKKDELQMENDSLNKYASEVRELLIQTKEEARNRNDMVQDLSSTLDNKGRVCQQLEKKIKELEEKLSLANEKRFKLQDSLSSIEKELQSTKASINKLVPEPQPRYRNIVYAPEVYHNACHLQRHVRTKKQENGLLNKFWKSMKSEAESSDIEMWMNYYHKKLNRVKRSFRTISNTIFQHDLNLYKNTPHGEFLNLDSNLTEILHTKPTLALVPTTQNEECRGSMKNELHNSAGQVNLTNNTAPSIDVLYNRPENLVITTSSSIAQEPSNVFNSGDCNSKSRDSCINVNSSRCKMSKFRIYDYPYENKTDVKRLRPNSYYVWGPTHYITRLKPRSRPICCTSGRLINAKSLIKSGSDSNISCLNESRYKGASNALVEEQKKFIDHTQNISYHLTKSKCAGIADLFKKLPPSYCQLRQSTSLVWHKTATEMEVSSISLSRNPPCPY